MDAEGNVVVDIRSGGVFGRCNNFEFAVVTGLCLLLIDDGDVADGSVDCSDIVAAAVVIAAACICDNDNA